MTTYIYERKDWPNFTWDTSKVSELLAQTRYKQGRLLGKMEAIGFHLHEEAKLNAITLEIIKSGEIEGEKLNDAQVKSSVARRLGLDIGALLPEDRNIAGVVDMILDATGNYNKKLSKSRLCGWHVSMFPTGYSGINKIRTGKWRDDSNGPMQVVSGPIGREKIHYQAPVAKCLEKEMAGFVEWFNNNQQMDYILKASIAHLWFVTIHPFEDGNGRIARALTDMLLARSEDSDKRFYSMSAQIRKERNAYYDILERTQKSDMDITEWVLWFLQCLGTSFDDAENVLGNVISKSGFWNKYAALNFNDRQKLIINKMLEGFEGKLTSSKWAKIAKCSQDTAGRDIADLLDKDILIKSSSGGRSTSYELKRV